MYAIDSKTEIPHQLRVVDEANELGKKITLLEDFISNNEIYEGLPYPEQRRLIDQREAMKNYFYILKERIENQFE